MTTPRDQLASRLGEVGSTYLIEVHGDPDRFVFGLARAFYHPANARIALAVARIALHGLDAPQEPDTLDYSRNAYIADLVERVHKRTGRRRAEIDLLAVRHMSNARHMYPFGSYCLTKPPPHAIGIDG